MVKIDQAAVLAGAKLAVIVAAASIVVAQTITSLTDGDANLLLYLVLLGGLAAGGWVAGRRQPEAPLTHGALAALSAYVLLIVVITLIRVALDKEVADPVSLVFNGLMAASAGMFGGYLTLVRPRRDRDTEAP
ncbi:MAG TPA: TIGR04086 family membrane protein [Acidimicrobiales bacterium]|nr:TIGR04086 family membrane protein [Acidimicrobiales bacterium]